MNREGFFMKKILAILLITSILLAFGACGGKDEATTTTTTTNETTVADETTTAEETTAAAETTVITDETTVASTETTVAAETTVTAETTTVAGTKPEGVDAIVTYFNTAVNQIKTDKPGYSHSNSHVIGNITSSSGFIETVAGWIVPMFDADPVVKTVAKGASHNDYPVAGQSWSSKLEPGSVKSATCTESGNNYVIEIKLKSESLSDLPSSPTSTNHGKVMTVLSADEVYVETERFKSFAEIKSFAPVYRDSYIKCTINKTTGKVVSSEYYFSTVASVNAKAKLFGDLDATVPFAIKDVYTLNY